jgi:antitoxin (DNA-binding transcriptional repressor) of toxin-antitoxin stability system
MYNAGMELNISHVRQRLLSLVDEIPEEGITIVRHGARVARLVPVEASRPTRRVALPLIRAKGKAGPLAPTTENPHDLILP